jgi:Putative Ig domain
MAFRVKLFVVGDPMNLRKSVFAITIGLALFLSACATGGAPNTVLPLAVGNTSVPVAVISKAYNFTLTATGGVGPYTWAIVSGTLPSGISMNSAGVISGTTTATGDSKFTVQVTDSQKPVAAIASSSLTLTANPALTLTTTSLKAAAINVPYQFSIQATGGASPYTWKILSGTLPAGLNFDTGFGVIYGTATAEGTFPLTIQVSDSEDPAVTMQQDYTLLVGGPDARLSGSYTFLFRGFLNGKLQLQAGSFVADGTGNITSGVTDIVNTDSVHSNVAVTGTYTMDDSNNGHGTMTLMFGPGGALGSGTYQLANSLAGYWSFLQNGDGQTTQYGSGTLQAQNPVPTDLTNSKGDWVFGGYGADSSNNRYAAGGTFNLAAETGANGTIGSGLTDTNDFGSVVMNTAFTGNMSLANATTGRGTFTFGTANFAWYYTDDSDFIAIETDKVSSSSPLILFNLLKVTTFIPVDNTILNGNGITELTSASSAGVPDDSLGDYSLDGKGNFFATIDDNTAGTLTQTKPQGTYSVTSTGRATFSGAPNSPIFYIGNTDQGFWLGTDANVTYGVMEQQRPPQQSNASFVNVNTGGTIIGPAVPTETVEVEILTADGMGNITAGTYDTSGPNGPMMGLSFTGTFNVDMTSCQNSGISFNTCGRFPLMDANNNQVGIGYIQASISPQRIIIMSTNPQPVINALQQ